MGGETTISKRIFPHGKYGTTGAVVVKVVISRYPLEGADSDYIDPRRNSKPFLAFSVQRAAFRQIAFQFGGAALGHELGPNGAATLPNRRLRWANY